MSIYLLHHTIIEQSKKTPAAAALVIKNKIINYQQLTDELFCYANGLLSLGIEKNDRIAVYLPKTIETVVTLFSSSLVGAICVPVNPILKTQQVKHILDDCSVRLLITSSDRLKILQSSLRNDSNNNSLEYILLIDDADKQTKFKFSDIQIHDWNDYADKKIPVSKTKTIDSDIACIFYTSGSTGKPKGVVLSHRNILEGGKSVNLYLKNSSSDRLLALLPLSFDYGFNQLVSAFMVGGCVVLMDYLIANDIIKNIKKYHITGLAAVPSLWIQLAQLTTNKIESIRYFTNSGGALPIETLQKLQFMFPKAKPFLMYGLTEAFRSTYVPPESLITHENSIGIAIPNAEVLVLREDGSECDDNEEGELVHRGVHVAQGYWNDIDKTARRFRSYSPIANIISNEKVVWSGDKVLRAKDGFLYFMSRKDDMIKTSGYRVSPSEIEEVMYQSGIVSEGVALGISHPVLGQGIILVVSPKINELKSDELNNYLKKYLPNYMQPKKIVIKSKLPRNINEKIDKATLIKEFQNTFQNNN